VVRVGLAGLTVAAELTAARRLVPGRRDSQHYNAENGSAGASRSRPVAPPSATRPRSPLGGRRPGRSA